MRATPQTTARTLVVKRSRNVKTGPVRIATYRTQVTCPVTCPLMGSGCYGENNGVGGSPTPFGHAARGDGDSDYTTLRADLTACNAGDVIRINVVGDYLTSDGSPDIEYINVINDAAARGVIVLAYTHAWRSLSPDLFHPSARPQASCDSPSDVSLARSQGWSTVIVAPVGQYANGDDIDGTRAVICPNVTNGIKCIDCKLCAVQRKSTIVFPIHGMRKGRAAQALAKFFAA